MAHCTPHRVGEASATELGTQNAPGKAPVRLFPVSNQSENIHDCNTSLLAPCKTGATLSVKAVNRDAAL